jgi:hypothetical protein
MSDRHEKWTPVAPGTVIPAGQPYRVEYEDGRAHEYPGGEKEVVWYEPAEDDTGVFVDSLWKPPLVLPTEPTWGVLVHEDPRNGQVTVGEFHLSSIGFFGGKDAKNVLDFIPHTAEQVARIEAAR